MAYINNTVISRAIYVADTAAALAIGVVGFITIAYNFVPNGKRRRRSVHTNTLNASDDLFHQSLYKVVTDLDDSGCAALALCHASSLPPEARTTDHNTVISALSPEPGLPVSWGDLHTPAAKYQYASLVGQWAALTTNQDQCSRVFPSCPLLPADVIKVLANSHVPCGQGPGHWSSRMRS
ncbi:uncharacterized protein [Procambarus clarkii]|uniref:uncharacterized protein n=1 Tax=Procambarus clarkii TaxID=6728 RepID=UPI00374435CC